ncbi:MFS transporter [Hyphococcus sp. DH-69]|uniref:MFS transporter n=1 Tax=Hyphococcus formosus TaxID=3143534 RepID=UPI00398ADD05
MPPTKVGFWTKFWFGFGQGAEGIKTGALTSVLFFYYSQVLGLDPALTGLALLIGVVTDGFSDALIGSWSDSLKHKWGRRHPFMYASAVPFGFSFILLFLPPDRLVQWQLFAWLVFWVVLARNFMTLFVVPHYALGAELSSDHDERTNIVAYRAFFGYVGSTLVFALGLCFFASTDLYPVGQLNPEKYPLYGIVLGGAISIMIIFSALGTHSAIPTLPKPNTAASGVLVRTTISDIRSISKGAAFRHCLAGYFVWVIGIILMRTLEIYMGTYFWRLEKSLVFLLPTIATLTMLAGTPFWPLIIKYIGKKRGFMLSVCGYGGVLSAMVLMHVFSLTPTQGTKSYLVFVFGGTIVASLFAAAPPVVGGSMIADIADDHDLRTGMRNEGILFGAISFTTKFSMGIAAQLAGLILSLIGLEARSDPAAVPTEVTLRLGFVAVLLLLVIGTVTLLVFRGYPISREAHDQIRKELSERDRKAALDETPTSVLKSSNQNITQRTINISDSLQST